MDILYIIRTTNTFIFFFIALISLYMFKHILEEYQQVRKLPGGRKTLNTVLIGFFFIMGFDALRSAVMSAALAWSLSSANLTFINAAILLPLNIVRLGLLLEFLHIAVVPRRE